MLDAYKAIVVLGFGSVLLAGGAILWEEAYSPPLEPALVELETEASPAQTDTDGVLPRTAACRTLQAWNEFESAARSRDMQRLAALFETDCLDAEGLEYSRVETRGGSIKVRVYFEGNSADLWTQTAAVCPNWLAEGEC